MAKELGKMRRALQEGDPIDGVKLSDGEAIAIIGKSLLGSGAKALPVFGVFFDLLENVDSALRDEKLRKLLASYQEKFSSTEEAIAKLKFLFSRREGVILAKKIVQIMDKGDADDDWLGLLGNALKHISEKDFEAQFEELAYTLSQIDRSSPQALLILSRFDDWRSVAISGTTTTSGQTTSGDWDMQLANAVSQQLGFSEPGKRVRMAHAFRELRSAGLIELANNKLVLPPVGDDVYRLVQ